MKNTKRILALLLTVVMVLSLVPVVALSVAAEDLGVLADEDISLEHIQIMLDTMQKENKSSSFDAAYTAGVADEDATVVANWEAAKTKLEETETPRLHKLKDSNENTFSLLEGTGTEDDPYLISTSLDWAIFAAFAGRWNCEGMYFELTADIDVSETFTLKGEDKAWCAINPVQAHSDEQVTYYLLTAKTSNQTAHKIIGLSVYFSGSFDGNGHTVSGFDVDIASGGHVALFRQIAGATIKNVTISDSIFKSTVKAYAAGIVGTVYGLASANITGELTDTQKSQVVNVIENCVVTDTVKLQLTAGGRAGGIVGNAAQGSGYRYNELTIKNCVSAATMELTAKDDYYFGGIIGIASGSTSYYVTVNIENCIATGSIKINGYTSSKLKVGGIAGYVNTYKKENGSVVDGTTISNCYANVVVEVALTANESSIDSTIGIGGVVGQMGSGTTAGQTRISNCYAQLALAEGSDYTFTSPVGHIVGNKTSSWKITIENCSYDTVTDTENKYVGISMVVGSDSSTSPAYTATNRSTLTDGSTEKAKEDYRDASVTYMVKKTDKFFGENAVITNTFTYYATSVLISGTEAVVLRHYFTLADGATAPETLTVGEDSVTVNSKSDTWYYIDIEVTLANAETDYIVKNGTTEITVKYESVADYAATLKTAAETTGASDDVKNASAAMQAFLAYATATANAAQ